MRLGRPATDRHRFRKASNASPYGLTPGHVDTKMTTCRREPSGTIASTNGVDMLNLPARCAASAGWNGQLTGAQNRRRQLAAAAASDLELDGARL